MKTIPLSVLLLMAASWFIPISLFSQDIFEKIKAEKVKDKLYLTLSKDTTFRYSIEKADKPLPLQPGTRFALKDRVNLYVEWLNPLLYSLNFQDSIFDDPVAAQVDEFFGSVVTLFSQATPTSPPLTKGSRPGAPTDSSSNPVTANFADLNLIIWKLYVNEHVSNGAPVQPLAKALRRLDSLLEIDYQSKANQTFKKLKSIVDPLVIIDNKDSFKTASNSLAKLKQIMDAAATSINAIKEINIDNINVNSTSAPSFKEYTKAVVLMFLKSAEQTHEKRNKDHQYLASIRDILVKSVEKKPREIKNDTYYYLVKTISPEKDKINKIKVDVTAFSYPDIYTKKVKATKKISFLTEAFQSFIPVITTGLFYSALDKVTYETSEDAAGNTIVAKAERDESGPVTALMLNYVLNSKMPVLPLLQVGVDPTKERPFLLMGGGLFLPGVSRKISISAGFAWTWVQDLKTLTVGEIVKGTEDIKEDLQYEFNPRPKGYVGFQFKF